MLAGLAGEALDRAADRHRGDAPDRAPSRTGADTEATPSSRSPTLCTQPPGAPASTLPALPADSGRRAPTGTIVRSSRGDSIDSTQTRASPSRTKSCTRLARLLVEPCEGGTGRRPQRHGLGRLVAEADQAQAEAEAAVVVAADEPVRLQGHRQPVGGRAAQPGGADQLGERARLGLDGRQHGHRLVEDADAAYTVHGSRSSSRNVRPSRGIDAWPQQDALREGVGPPRGAAAHPASPTCSTSTSTSSTRSPARRRSTASGWPAAGSAAPTSPSPPRTTTCPTEDIDKPVEDPISAKQLEVLAANTAEFGITHYGMGDPNQGIVHVIGPEQGRTLPGMTIVCGDSHTSTHGAFGALAFGIGTSEVEHVLATQTLPQQRPGTMAVTVTGELPGRRHRQGRDPRHHRRASAPAAASAR